MGCEMAEKPTKLAQAQLGEFSYSPQGSFYMPLGYNTYNAASGITPEKLVVPKDYHQVLILCYDFYQRGGSITTVVNRLAEFSITEIRNGQRKTTDEANILFDGILHSKPSRLGRFLNTMSLEYWLSGLLLPRVDWVETRARDISPDLARPNKTYLMPQFDLYPPLLVAVDWAGWGEKVYYLKIPTSDVRLLKSGGSRIKDQQARYEMFVNTYPWIVDEVKNGSDKIRIKDSDPILRKEISYSPYPTPYLFNVLEALIFKQQLRRMDYAVAARIINAILLVQEGNDNFPLTEETRENLDTLKTQVFARSANPAMAERLFALFTNHTTKLTWIVPDVAALLDQDKYRQTNEELAEGLGFAKILMTGESRNAGASEVSTWSIQPQMELFRTELLEWIQQVYVDFGERNSFRKIAKPLFKPVKLQDFVKTAAVFAQAFKEGNLSRTTRNDMLGLDFETEVELMKDEKELMKDLPAFPPMPYSPAPPMGMGNNSQRFGPVGGRPQGSQNVPVNNRNTGVRPPGQAPTSRVAAEEIELLSDEELINLFNKVAEDRGLVITQELLEESL